MLTIQSGRPGYARRGLPTKGVVTQLHGRPQLSRLQPVPPRLELGELGEAGRDQH